MWRLLFAENGFSLTVVRDGKNALGGDLPLLFTFAVSVSSLAEEISSATGNIYLAKEGRQ